MNAEKMRVLSEPDHRAGEPSGDAMEDSADISSCMNATSSLSDLKPIRQFVLSFCNYLNPPIPDEGRYKLVLAATEAATNIMRHAYRGRTGQPIRVVAEANDDAIRVVFRHHGSSFDPANAPPSSMARKMAASGYT
jgi:anti-sigma regulatory factor (Ser/Thr protein kinase)